METKLKVGDIVRVDTVLNAWSPSDDDYWRDKLCKVVHTGNSQGKFPISIRPIKDTTNIYRCIGFKAEELVIVKGLGQVIYGE